jgi:glycosyltransferase involved in cell wall biosynthesis
MSARVLVIAGTSHSLVNFRRPLLNAMLRRGHDVVAVAPADSNWAQVDATLRSDGVRLEAVPIQRKGLNPLADLRTIRRLTTMIREIRPDRILAYMAKPVVYGGIAARRAGGARFFPMITGLGHPFAENGDIRQRALHLVVRTLYRSGLKSARCVIFQNEDDRAMFESLGLIPEGVRTRRVFGSGVDLALYRPQPLPAEPSFLMLSRMLLAKGVREYAEAARMVKERYPSTRFLLAGPSVPGSDGIDRSMIDRWEAAGHIEYLGHLDDVRPVLARSRFVVLPSYYREGVPRSLLEGLATGRPLITTDTPGCRDTVEDGLNGLLVPPRDTRALATAMLNLLEASDEQVSRMGCASLELAYARFDVEAVNEEILSAIEL